MKKFGLALLGFALAASACSSSQTAAPAASETVSPTSSATPASAPSTTAVAPVELTAEDTAAFEAAVDQFMQDRSVGAARQVVDYVARSGDRRYAPWLVDLAQLGLSNLLSTEIIEVLAGLVGLEPTGDDFADFGRAGSVVETERIEPAPGYRQWKLSIFERLDPEFLPLLDSVSDVDRFNRIRYGGVRRGGIPELNDPARISAGEALEWITDDEIVLGIELNGEVVAYPFRIIGHHELINDTVGGVPVSAVYCTLCRTGLLFDRQVSSASNVSSTASTDGPGSEAQVLDFQTSGLLINSNKIMVDRQTDTLWHHAAGLGIGGELEGVTLAVLPMETVTWAEWYARHPETEVLEIPGPIFFDEPERPPIAYPYEAGGPYSAYYDDPRIWYPIRAVSDVFAPKTEVLGINHGGGLIAVAVDEIVSGPSRYFQVGDGAVVVAPSSRGGRVYAAGPDALAALSSLEQGAEVTLASLDGSSAQLAGGEVLERIAVEQGFWFSWHDRHPDTGVWPG